MVPTSKVVRWGLTAVAVSFAAAQLIRPARTNPPVDPAQRVDAHLNLPPDVKAILDRSCRDCHTNETRWPRYSTIAPISWYVVHDVTEGREEMNFSEWGRYDRDEAREKLNHLCRDVRRGKMPATEYTWMHPEAKLSPSEIERLCTWADAERARPMNTLRR